MFNYQSGIADVPSMVEKVKTDSMFLLSPNDIFEEFGDIALDQYGFPSYYFEVSCKTKGFKSMKNDKEPNFYVTE